MNNYDPALLAFFGTIVSALSLILVEQIRNRRKTEDVKQEVINTKDSSDTQLTSLALDVRDIKNRLNDHIQWHLEGERHVYLYPRQERRY